MIDENHYLRAPRRLLALAWFGLTAEGVASGSNLVEAALRFDQIRILSVLPRLAIAYGVAALLALACGTKRLTAVTAAILIVYAVVLVIGYGYEFSERNIIATVDRMVLGEPHMYSDWVDGALMKFDPEGLLSTLPSVAHVLIGFMAGRMLMSESDNRRHIYIKI